MLRNHQISQDTQKLASNAFAPNVEVPQVELLGCVYCHTWM